MKEKLTKERVINVLAGIAVGIGATMAVTNVGRRNTKEAFIAGARMVGYRAGVSNISGYSTETNVDRFDNLTEFDSYVEELYEEYMDNDI